MQINSFGLKEKICYIMYFAEASILGGGGGNPQWKYWGGGDISFPPPIIFCQLEKLLCNARIGLKSTRMHYKTIKFNIKIPL